MAIYKCADEACTAVYEFQRTQPKPLGERVRHLLEVSNTNDLNGIGDAFFELVQPTRLVIDEGKRIRSPLAYQPPQAHDRGSREGITPSLDVAGIAIPPHGDLTAQFVLDAMRRSGGVNALMGSRDVADQISRIIARCKQSPSFQKQFIEITRRHVKTGGEIGRKFYFSSDVQRLLEGGSRLTRAVQWVNQNLLMPVGHTVRSGLAWIGNTRAVQISLQAGRQLLEYAVRVGRPVVVAVGTTIGGVVAFIFAVPEFTIAAGILLVVIVIGSVVYLIRSN